MASTPGSTKVIYAALAGNAAIAVTKFTAAALSGSASMLSEAIHSTVDTGNELLLLYGQRRAARPADHDHPLGHGRELYFWSFVVALLVFALGAGVSFWEGVQHIRNPEPGGGLTMNLVVLGLSFVFEAYSWNVARREVAASKGRLGYLAAARRSKDPTSFTVLFEDSAALLGILIAAAAIIASHVTGIAALDGVGSIGIGLVLAATALFLARESKGLLIGERALPEVEEKLRACAASQPGVARVNALTTVHLAPDAIVLSMSVAFDDSLGTEAIEAATERLEQALRAVEPALQLVMVKPRGEAAPRGLDGAGAENHASRPKK